MAARVRVSIQFCKSSSSAINKSIKSSRIDHNSNINIFSNIYIAVKSNTNLVVVTILVVEQYW